jgi:hypothetical protein
VIRRGPIILQGHGDDDFAKKQPRAEACVEQAGIFAEPAQAGVLGMYTLYHWPGIHIEFAGEW